MLDITVLLDRSGSMQFRKEDHEGGLISFIQDNQDKEANFTFIQFDGDDPFQILIDEVQIKSVNLDEIKLIPRGSTPLYDAIGETISYIDKRKNNKLKILFIVSDGENNSSKEWTSKMIKDEISKRPNWKFLFLGTNQDALEEGDKIGITRTSSVNYTNTSIGINAVYKATSDSIKRMYNSKLAGHSDSDACFDGNYTSKERLECRAGDINHPTPKE